LFTRKKREPLKELSLTGAIYTMSQSETFIKYAGHMIPSQRVNFVTSISCPTTAYGFYDWQSILTQNRRDDIVKYAELEDKHMTDSGYST